MMSMNDGLQLLQLSSSHYWPLGQLSQSHCQSVTNH